MIFIFGSNFTNYDFGNRIMERRKHCGFKSQAALAACMVQSNGKDDEQGNLVESKRKAISNWEKGSANPSLSDFVLLCKILDCDTQYLLGEIDVPRVEEKSVMDVTGLSEKAVEKLIRIKDGNCVTWWSDTLNLIIENENFIDLIHTITNYIDDDGADAQIPNAKIAATSTKKLKNSDLLQFKAQNLLFLILHEEKEKYSPREDARVFYSMVYSALRNGLVEREQAESLFAKLDSGDIHGFLKEMGFENGIN